MIKGDMTVREWLEDQKKANEKLALDIIDQKQYQIDNLEEENKKLKYVIDILMEKTGIENIKLATGEVFLNPKKRLKLNTDFIEEDTLQELRDLGEI